jgi:hypothetical protein
MPFLKAVTKECLVNVKISPTKIAQPQRHAQCDEIDRLVGDRESICGAGKTHAHDEVLVFFMY